MRELEPPPTPLPPCYDVNARCEFHSSAPGHNIENFKALKHKVQDLIDSKAISFAPNGPNANNNPMPPHASPSVSMVEESQYYSLVIGIGEMKNSLTLVKDKLLSNDVFPICLVDCEQCLLDPQNCEKLRGGVQQLMNEGIFMVE